MGKKESKLFKKKSGCAIADIFYDRNMCSEKLTSMLPTRFVKQVTKVRK